MRLSMGIDAARAAESRRKVEAAIDRIEHELQPSGYLVGDAFSVADLTAAALLSPVVLPREFPYVFPSPLPESVQRYRDSLADRRAVAWTEEMYRRHRGRSAEVAA
jgi:glutathione S-transferase